MDFTNLSLCNIDRFKKIVHIIIDYKYPNINNEKLHDEISNNNFTKVIMLGLVDLKEE